MSFLALLKVMIVRILNRGTEVLNDFEMNKYIYIKIYILCNFNAHKCKKIDE